MTNKEWMVTLTAEEFYDTMEWLTHVYSKQFTDSRLAITTWLDKEHEQKPMDFSKYKCRITGLDCSGCSFYCEHRIGAECKLDATMIEDTLARLKTVEYEIRNNPNY